jgi:hypothetical protein
MEGPEEIGHHGRQLFKVCQSQRLVLVNEGHIVIVIVIVMVHIHIHMVDALCMMTVIFL